jgi:hypothetical protein
MFFSSRNWILFLSKWHSALPFSLPFSFQLSKCICDGCDDVEMKCSCIEQAGCQLKQQLSSLLCLFFFLLSTNLMLNRDKRKKKKKRKDVSWASFFCICLYMYIISSQCGCTFSNQSMHTHKVTNMIIIRAHSMCQNYHIYFVWSRLYICIVFDPVQYLFFSSSFIDLMSFKVGIINDKSFNLYFLNELFN